MTNIDPQTVAGFGNEWTRFDQAALSEVELAEMFAVYFRLFPWDSLSPTAVGFDLGCGSGRWARFVAPRVARLHCIDASEAAIEVARKTLHNCTNCEFHVASVDAIPLPDVSMDFGYSLGVLHHVPDTFAGLQACVAKLKPGAPFLLYLYYALENRPRWYRGIWSVTNSLRRLISILPLRIRYVICSMIAALVYWPLARLALVLERRGRKVDVLPLMTYRNRNFYVMRTDALDRFGTRLEHRFTAQQIHQMMRQAGLDNIEFLPAPPYWCAVGYRKQGD
jgi:ubiquinone/menaquinone biosynthesis C-methylase UbiE